VGRLGEEPRCEVPAGCDVAVGDGAGAAVEGGDEEGMKDTASVPEKRTMLIASATGRTADLGFGQLRLSVVSTPIVITSLKSTSIRACSLSFSFPVLPGPYQKPSSAGMTLQLLKMGNSSPSAISVTLISPIQSGLLPVFSTSVSEVRIASSCRASALSCAIVCAMSTLNQSKLSG
jgi:hypothetical protein